jgi:hypothetical protein
MAYSRPSPAILTPRFVYRFAAQVTSTSITTTGYVTTGAQFGHWRADCIQSTAHTLFIEVKG